MNVVEEIYATASSCEEYATAYLRYLSRLLEQLDVKAVAAIVQVVAQARQEGRTIFLAGNGGSAATAAHFAQDLALGARAKGMPLFKTICLAESASRITTLGNDRSYEEIFTGQMEGIFKAKDVLIAFSASGNSPNVVRAIQYANELGGITVGIVGFDGGKMKALCQVCLHIPTRKGEYGPVEAVHTGVTHLLTNYLGAPTK